MILQFFVINKSGGLIYAFERSRTTSVNRLMVLTSTLHSISAILGSIEKEPHRLDATHVFHFGMHIITLHRTVTGTSFMFVGRETAHKWIAPVLRAYVNHVMKDPFYIPEMPINSRNFRPEALLEEIL